jgi:hypothetical protein
VGKEEKIQIILENITFAKQWKEERKEYIVDTYCSHLEVLYYNKISDIAMISPNEVTGDGLLFALIQF